MSDAAPAAALISDPSDPSDASEASTRIRTSETFAAGAILGNRYRVRSLLGRGGMGEVWRALDLKLRVDVALKALRPRLHVEQRLLDTLRQEVRVAREVVSPNVCRVFDLIELDGREMVSMEYIDGMTLREILVSRSPLQGDEAREIASQLLAGLEAIHAAGLVHRDIKPENVMVTHAGRVVVMDFGIAKALAAERQATVAGTPAYMSPEQARGEPLDARADVFSVGVVLAEMVAPAGTRDHAARGAVWGGIHRDPPELAETAWAPVLRKAVAPQRELRLASAAALQRALEEVTLRVAGAEMVEPYPGLASFSAGNAEYFFGRELEIESMWRKLRRPHLMALVGPSGAGKSSFLRAGLLATAPAGWRSVITNPGDRPWKALAQSLIPELAGDPEGLELLLRIEEPEAAVAVFSRWRRRHEQALLVLDQFEELFTQNSEEVQAAFAAVLGRLALDADVHVLLSMRDDFLFRCHAHEVLRPLLSELTLLGPPAGAALRRALVQPALKCGYRFEDEALIDEMLREVEGERGALPLLSFAAAQLWQRRDRERGLLTRDAYSVIGGVAGALAQHAEATLERIGQDRVPIVRELFRNLVTAEGTRLTVDRESLLSVFAGDREPASQVLDTLIGARLLTSYESAPEVGENAGEQRIEIVHESLLSQWPRLVHWQAQDQEGSLLRDQLRQVARLWEQRGEPEDLLWTGTSFREYELWRERYAGKLSATEDSFTRAMTARAARRRRRRGMAVAAVVAAALAVALGLGVLWRRSETARRLAEASKLLALAEVELARFPTAALAYATRSLEVADTPEGRLFALRALQLAPPMTLMPMKDGGKVMKVAWSPAGDRLAVGGRTGCDLYPSDGSPPIVLAHTDEAWAGVAVEFAPSGDRVLTSMSGEVRAFSVAEGRELWRRPADASTTAGILVRGDQLFFEKVDEDELTMLQRLSFDGGEPELIGRYESDFGTDIDVQGLRLAFTRGREIYLHSLTDWSAPPQVLGEHSALVKGLSFHPSGERLAAADAAGEIRIWATGPAPWSGEPLRTLASDGLDLLQHDPRGRWLAAYGQGGRLTVRLWDLEGPPEAEPLSLEQDTNVGGTFGVAFESSGDWLAMSNVEHVSFWPLGLERRYTLPGRGAKVNDVAFTSDGRGLLTVDEAGFLRLWPMTDDAPESRVLLKSSAGLMRVLPVGDQSVLATGYGGQAFLVPLSGGRASRLEGFSRDSNLGAAAVDPKGRWIAAAPTSTWTEDHVIRVWDAASGAAVRVIDPRPQGEQGGREMKAGGILELQFLEDSRLLASESDGLRVWDPRDGSVTELSNEHLGDLALAPDGSTLLASRLEEGPSVATERPSGELVRSSLEGGRSKPLPAHESAVTAIAIDSTGTLVVTGSADGLVRVGRSTGEEPWIEVAHDEPVLAVAISPDGRWIASAGSGQKVDLWRTPDLSRPPLQALPHDRLLAELHSLTNLEVVEDEASPTGWKLEVGPFRGWAKAPGG
jgi:WD40 repeat protein